MMPRVRHAIALALVLTASGSSCGAPGRVASGPQVVVPAGSVATPALPAANAPPQNPSTGRISCGKGSCDASIEVCCGFGGDQGCAPRVRANESQQPEQRLEPLIESCKQAVKSEYSFDFLGTCDDSTDCPQGQVCCSQWMWSGAGLLECVPASATGESVCDFHERCAGDSCRTRNTQCAGAECHLAGARVRCADQVCGADAPVCCMRGFEGPPKCERDCEPPNDEARAFEFECSGPASCPPGAVCQAGMFGSFCARLVDTAGAVTLCESDQDCPRDGCAWLGKTTPPSCKPGHSPGFTHCSCD